MNVVVVQLPLALSEIGALESLRELPIRRRGVDGDSGCTIASDSLERERLSHELVAIRALPYLSPVAFHGIPIRVRTLHEKLLHVPGSGHVRYKHHNEVGIAVHGEPHAALLLARHSEKYITPIINGFSNNF